MSKAERRKVLIENYYPLVEIVINNLLSNTKYSTFSSHKDDLLGEGMLALIDAVDTFDIKKGIKPETYFSMRIRGSAKDYIKKYMREWGTLIYIEGIDSEITEGIEKEDTYNEDWVAFVDKYEPEDDVSRRIYHEILMGTTTYRELGDVLGLSRKAVERRASKLRKQLKKQMLKDKVMKEIN